MDAKAKQQSEKMLALKPIEVDPHPHDSVTGVLLSDEISYYATEHKLIDPFEPTNLKPAAYELTIGDEYMIGGELHSIDPEAAKKNPIIIPPFEVAVLKTAEILRLPRFMIARWNIKVSLAYAGLLWVGGPQVDPGWVGNLFCPIYNLSDRAVVLQLGDRIAVMDFVKTSPFHGKDSLTPSMEYGFPPKRLTLRDYGVGELRSALFTKAGRQLVVMEERVAALQARFDIFTTISFSIIALILALVLGTASRVLLVKVAGAQLAALTLAVAVFAALVALFSYIDRWSTRALFERYGQVIGLRLGTLQTIMHSWRYVSIVVFAATALVIATILYVKTDHIDSSYVTHAELLRMQKDIQSKMQGAAPAAGGTARRSDGA